jgi:hypothetical protein
MTSRHLLWDQQRTRITEKRKWKGNNLGRFNTLKDGLSPVFSSVKRKYRGKPEQVFVSLEKI